MKAINVKSCGELVLSGTLQWCRRLTATCTKTQLVLLQISDEKACITDGVFDKPLLVVVDWFWVKEM